MEQWAKTLGAVQKQYGVPASIVVAIWGRESGFGKVDMPFDALSAIATQGFMGRRPEIFRQEVIAALKILGEKHATRAELREPGGRRHGLHPVPAVGFREICRRFRR